MKKTYYLRIISALLVFVMLFSLAACNKDPQQVTPAHPDNTAPSAADTANETAVPDPTEPAKATPVPVTADVDFSYTFDPNTDCFAVGSFTLQGLAETEDAYYWRKPFGGFVFYSDKGSGEFGALCGKPDCLHDLSPNNSECNALVGYNPLSSLYVYDGKLYYMSSARTADGRVLDTVFREELDGSNRKQLFSIDSFEHAFQRFFIHRGKAFFTAETDIVEDGLPKKRLEFFCGELNGDGVHSVFEKTIDGELGFSFSAGFYGDYAFLFVSTYKVSAAMASNSDTTLYAYDLKNDKVYLIASQENCEISIWAVYVDTNGEIYVVPSQMNKFVQAGVYKVVNGEFVKHFEFEGEEYFGGYSNLGGGFAFSLQADWDLNGADTIWLKDMDGNTVYNGPLTRHFIEGRENVKTDVKDMMMIGNSLLIAYTGWLKDAPDYSILVRYEITENGLTETTLAEY